MTEEKLKNVVELTNSILIMLKLNFRFYVKTIKDDLTSGISVNWDGFCKIIKITFPDNHVKIEIINPCSYDGVIENEDDYYNYYDEIEMVRKLVVEIYCNRDKYMNLIND